jgi:predicted neutral ceramidase superfamily lipid hydrolase
MTKFDPSRTSKRWMLYVTFVALISWAGWWSVIQLPINDLTKTLFFALLFTSIGSSLMPAVAYLNARFGRFHNQRIYYVRFVRQSILVGAFVVVIAWLQMRRVLSSTLGLILLAVFVLTETFLITRETPPKES